MKDFKIYLTLISILLLVYIVAEYNKPAPIIWSPTLNYKDKVPFGTYIIFNRLNDLFPNAKIVETTTSLYQGLTDSTVNPGNYIMIAKTVSISKDDYTEMVNYIKQGSSVFISCFDLKGFIVDTLKLGLAEEFGRETAELNFTNTALNKNGGYSFGHDISNQYFKDFDTTKATVIGQNNNGNSTFLSFKFGKGKLLICLNPGVFTNYGILSTRDGDYATKALSYLPKSKTVYWDQFQNSGVLQDESPMRIFFRYPTLKWAYYISLFGILTFILFEIKRRQRIIPVITPLQNATLDFVNVVGQVYYEKRDNINIAHKKILYLFTFLRDNYQLKTTILDNEFIDRFAEKLEIDKKFATALIDHIRYISVQKQINDHDLIELNKLIEKFYTLTR